MIVVDTSGMLAAIDGADAHHTAAVEAIRADEGPRLVSPFVLAELDHLTLTRYGVSTGTAFLRQASNGAYELVPFGSDDVAEATNLIERYQDLRIGLADASIAVIASRLRTTRVLTLDERHFRPMRPLWGDAFTLLPKDQWSSRA